MKSIRIYLKNFYFTVENETHIFFKINTHPMCKQPTVENTM